MGKPRQPGREVDEARPAIDVYSRFTVEHSARGPLLWPSVTLLALAGCSAPRPILAVELRTDYGPGEVASVETAINAGSAEAQTHRVDPENNYQGGVRIAEWSLDRGSHLIRITLRDREGNTIATQQLRVALQESTAVTALVTRSCAEVSCEVPGSLQCLGGTCVDESCLIEDGSGCGTEPECSSERPCETAGLPECVRSSCSAESLCFLSPDSSLCAVGARCDFIVGCVPDVDEHGFDAGTTRDGAVVSDAGECTPGPVRLEFRADGDTVNVAPCSSFTGRTEGTVNYGPGRAGLAWQFRSTQAESTPDPDFVEVESREGITLASLAVDIWARQTGFNEYSGSNRFLAANFSGADPVSSAGTWALYLHENRQTYFIVTTSDGRTRGVDWESCRFGTLPDDTWYRATATYDGVWLGCWLDGVEVDRVPLAGSIPPLRRVEVGRSFPGDVDAFRILDATLLPSSWL